MLKLSAFADEIGPALDDQIRVMKANGVSHFELRSIDKVNVLAFTDDQRNQYKKQIQEAGLGVVSIGSPCGKKPIDTAEPELLDMFKKAVEMAVHFEAPFIRVFSFYPAGGEGQGPIESVRDRAIDLLTKQCDLLTGTNVRMIHENEKGIYGDTGERCLDLLSSVNHPRFRAAFDFANFVQCGEDPLTNWPKLKPFTVHIHIKDARQGTGEVVPAGQGDGQIGPILKDVYASGYRDFVSMEPHLKVAGHSHGETGPELFGTAVTALRRLCETSGIPLAGK